MANGLARITTGVSAFLGFTPSELSRMHSSVLAAAEDSTPVKKEKLESKYAEFKEAKLEAFRHLDHTAAGKAVLQLSNEVADAKEALDSGVDGISLLNKARRENERESRGLQLQGGGDVPHDLWVDARNFARNVDKGFMVSDKAVALLSSKDDLESRLCTALGKFFAGYQAGITEAAKLHEKAEIATRRAAEAEVINLVHMNDSLRRARYAGKDTSPIMSEAVASGMEKGLSRGVDRIKDLSEIGDLKQMVADLSKLVHTMVADKAGHPPKDGE